MRLKNGIFFVDAASQAFEKAWRECEAEPHKATLLGTFGKVPKPENFNYFVFAHLSVDSVTKR